MNMRYLVLPFAFIALMGHAQWQQLPDFPGTPRDDAAAFAIGADVFVGTGKEADSLLTNDWYRFDGDLWQWSQIAALPATPRHYCSAFALTDPDDDYGYLFGGLDDTGPLNELWRYDPMTNTWTQMSSLPGEPRHAAVAFDGGYIATGLLADSTATNELWKYDPVTDSWEQLASLPGTSRHRACGAELLGRTIIGGVDGNNTILSDCWTYDATTDSWSDCVSLPEGRYSAMCGFAGYDDLLIGGSINDSTIVETGFKWNLTSWLPSGDPHPGGTRRGGIMVGPTENSAGGWDTYLGLGLSNDGMRHNDWYVTGGAFSVNELSMGKVAVHPNPTSGALWIEMPEQWANAECIVYDGIARAVTKTRVMRGSPIDLESLSAGRYDLVISYGDERKRASVIKLP